MAELTLRNVHPTEAKEVASLSARVITTFVIAMAWILSLAPFAVYYSQP